MTAQEKQKNSVSAKNIFPAATTMSVADVFAHWQTGVPGLIQSSVDQRLVTDGLNVIRGHVITSQEIFLRQFRSPFIYLLTGAAILSFFLHERIDGVLILLFIFINTSLGFYQEFRSAKALQLLRRFSSPKSRVIRHGRETTVVSQDLVAGDILVLEPGDIVSADARIIAADTLLIDESVLTGESIDVQKNADPLAAPASQPYQAKNIAFAGSTVVSGSGRAVIISTGRRTVMGEISRLAVETEKISGFQQGIAGFSRFVLIMISVTLVLVFAANILIKGADANIGELLIFSIALAVSVVPEALPVVTTLAMTRGALRLAKNHVVVKRLSAIEDLGSIDVLCTDKTGTITQNSMSVAAVQAENRQLALQLGVAGSTSSSLQREQHNNAFEAALWESLSVTERQEVSSWRVVHHLPFDPNRRRETVVVRMGDDWRLISRGAPEVLAEHCTLSSRDRQAMLHWSSQAGRDGQRVMAIAQRSVTSAVDPKELSDEQELQVVGLVAFADPLKVDAVEAIAQAKQLGVAVKILTGDAPEVAGAIGYQVKLIDDPAAVMTGADFDALRPLQQHQAVRQYAVFARLSPQQKFSIIHLLEETLQVGFLGEGMNDAPALKVATVSLVVEGASDVARENADIILLKKDLSVIIRGIGEGRTVFANTIKYIKSTLLSNFGNFYAVAAASLFIDFLPFLPVQILLVNLLSDFPMIAIASDSVDAQELRRPHHYQVRDIALFATMLGLVSTMFDFMFFGVFSRLGEGTLQTYWFIGSILTELLVIYSIRTRHPFWRAARPSRYVVLFTAAAAAMAIIIPFTRVGQTAFHFLHPVPTYLLWTLLLTLGYLVTNEIVKLGYYRIFDRQPESVTRHAH